ncbi:hypothetical protein [Streptomyces sp. Act143]|nr:hypothetical protein [Streptomyces sp. Act143]
MNCISMAKKHAEEARRRSTPKKHAEEAPRRSTPKKTVPALGGHGIPDG